MKTRSNAYWERRAQQRMAGYHKDANSTIKTITAAYDQAKAELTAEIGKIYKTFRDNAELDDQTARRYLNQRIPNPLLDIAKKLYPKIKDDRVKRWLLNRMNAPAYRARITRLQALREQILLQSKLIADAELTASGNGYVKAIREAYYRHMFDIQRGLGVGFEFATMPTRVIEEILQRPWSGEHFSDRVWTNTGVLAENLTQTLTSGLMSGAPIERLIRGLAEDMNVAKFAASRLLRTEYTYMTNMAEIEAYKAAGVEQYLFVATLDKRTSAACRLADGQVHNVEDAVPGKTLPPLHPWCRSTTRGYFGPETLEGIQRRARDPETGKTMLVPANMNYEQWRKVMDNKYDNGLGNGNRELKVTDSVRDHASKGEFTNPKNPKKQAVGKFKNGGHGQENIQLLEQYGIQYNIVKEYDNGVRIGNVPDHKEKIKQTGTKQSWFPATWKAADIHKAGEYVANLKDKSKYTLEPKWNNDELIAVFKYANYKGVIVGVVYDAKQRKITTVFPDETQRLTGGE